MYYVYSLKCRDGYYVGCTNDIEDRIDRHSKGQISATSNRLPIKLEFYFAAQDKYISFKFEKYLKSGVRNVYREAVLRLSDRAFRKKHFF